MAAAPSPLSGRIRVGTSGYSLWGSSAGARMAAAIGSHGAGRFGGSDVPKPATVVMAYTAHSDYTAAEPATFVVVGEQDSIAPPASTTKTPTKYQAPDFRRRIAYTRKNRAASRAVCLVRTYSASLRRSRAFRISGATRSTRRTPLNGRSRRSATRSSGSSNSPTSPPRPRSLSSRPQ